MKIKSKDQEVSQLNHKTGILNDRVNVATSENQDLKKQLKAQWAKLHKLNSDWEGFKKQTTEKEEVMTKLTQNFIANIDLLSTDEQLSKLISTVPSVVIKVKEQLEKENLFLIDMTKAHDIRILTFFSFFKITHQTDFIVLRNWSENDKDIIRFLNNSLTSTLKAFDFNLGSKGDLYSSVELKNCINIDAYMDGLIQCIPNITIALVINNCEMSQTQFSTIIKSAHKVQSVVLSDCYIVD